MTEAAAPPELAATPPRPLFPQVGAFSATMGLAGTATACYQARALHGWPLPAEALFWFAAGGYVLLTVAYLAKSMHSRGAIRQELSQINALELATTFPITALLLAAGALRMAPVLAAPLWWFGTALVGIINLAVYVRWFSRPTKLAGVSPVWVIPAASSIIVGFAGMPLGHSFLSLVFVGGGLAMWLALLPLVISRLILSGPLQPPARPTLAILVSPPSVGAISLALFDRSSSAIPVLVGAACLFAAVTVLVLLTQARTLVFATPAWALGFPLAALTNALLLLSGPAATVVHALSLACLVLLLAVLGVLSLRSGLRKLR